MTTSAQRMGEMLMNIIMERKRHRQAHMDGGVANMVICYGSHLDMLNGIWDYDPMSLDDEEIALIAEACALMDMGERLMSLHPDDTLVVMGSKDTPNTAKWNEFLAQHHRQWVESNS